MWQCLLNFLETQAPVISLATVILMAIYVLYTIRTFKSIHRQTELLSEAYLLVSCYFTQEGSGSPGASPGSSGTSGYSGFSTESYASIYTAHSVTLVPMKYNERIEQEMAELYKKWGDILSTSLPAAKQPAKDITLHLQNRGKSDIVWWKINVKAHIEPGKYLASKFNINGEDCSWSIEYKGFNEIIASDNSISMVIGKSGVFPELTLSWAIEYKDMKDVPYKRFGGDRSATDKNAFADPEAYVNFLTRPQKQKPA